MIALECVGLKKSFGGLCAVDNVNIVFDLGKISALIGPNGAGKTTLFFLINGYLKPDKGKILFKNREIQSLPSWKIARMGIGRLFQDTRIFPGLTVEDNILVAFKEQLGENPIWAALRTNGVKKEDKKNRVKTNELIEYVGLNDHNKTYAGELSYGQQKLLSFARLLANDADILLLDEPTAGVDHEMKKKIIDLIKKISHENNKTIVIIEHDMEVVMQTAAWVFFMNEGKVVARGKPQDLLVNSMVRETYIGL